MMKLMPHPSCGQQSGFSNVIASPCMEVMTTRFCFGLPTRRCAEADIYAAATRNQLPRRHQSQAALPSHQEKPLRPGFWMNMVSTPQIWAGVTKFLGLCSGPLCLLSRHYYFTGLHQRYDCVGQGFQCQHRLHSKRTFNNLSHW